MSFYSVSVQAVLLADRQTILISTYQHTSAACLTSQWYSCNTIQISTRSKK